MEYKIEMNNILITIKHKNNTDNYYLFCDNQRANLWN